MKQYRHRRSSNPSNAFPTLEPGELSVNTANRQLAAGDAASGTVGAPLPLIAVRYFDARGKYAVGDYVVSSGTMYKCTTAHGPAAFNPSNFTAVGTGGGGGATLITSTTPPTPAVDNTLWWDSDNGLLYLRYNDGNSSQWVLASPIGGGGGSGGGGVSGDYLPLTGGNLTGITKVIGASFLVQETGINVSQGFAVNSYTNHTAGQFIDFANDYYSEGISFGLAGGTEAAPLPVQTNAEIGYCNWGGHDGAQFVWSAAITGAVDGPVSAGVVPVALVLKSGTGAFGTERLRLASNGSTLFDKPVSATVPTRYQFGNCGGVYTDSGAGHWRGLFITGPMITDPGDASNLWPHISIYAEYDSLTAPASRSWCLDMGNHTATSEHTFRIRDNQIDLFALSPTIAWFRNDLTADTIQAVRNKEYSSGDLNNLNATCWVNGAVMAHAPNDSTNWWFVTTQRHTNDNGFLVQQAMGLNTEDGKLFQRHCHAGAWTPWVEFTNKTYVDAADALKADKTYVDAADAALSASVTGKVAKTGDTMTGALVMKPLTGPSYIIVDNTPAAQQAIVQFNQSGTAKWLLGKQTNDFFVIYDATSSTDAVNISPGAGGTIGLFRPVILSGDPSAPLHPATKQYVDAGVRTFNSADRTAYTLVLSDTGKIIALWNSTAQPLNLTVPPNSAVAFAIGAEIDLMVTASIVATVVAGSGVSITSEDNKRRLPKLGSCATLVKVSTDAWVLCGSLIA